MRYALALAALGLAACTSPTPTSVVGSDTNNAESLEQKRNPPSETAGFGAAPVGTQPNYVGPPVSGPPLPPAPPPEALASRQMPAPQINSDGDFVTYAGQAGVAAEQAGRIAAQRGTAEVVKSFGERTAKEQEKANRELRKMAGRLPGMGVDEQREMARLRQLSGTQFDRAFMEQAIRERKELLDIYRKEATQSQRKELKEFAGKMARETEEQLRLAERIVGNEFGAGEAARAMNP